MGSSTNVAKSASILDDKHDEDIKVSPVGHIESVDEKTPKSKTERSLILKLDLLIIPILSLTFLVAYMDRNNLGNARIMTLQKDTHMSNEQFYNALMMFYVGYLLFALPGNLALKAFGPHRSIGGACVLFGIFVCCMSTAKNFSTILGMRILIGFAQAFIQGGGLYLSTWYKRNELGTRASVYYSTATISGCFSGLIAYGVQKDMNGAHGRAAWQWFFLIEGIASIGIGLAVWLTIPPFPDRVKKHWPLKQEEIELARVRSSAYNVMGEKIRWSQVWEGFKDPKTYMFASIYGGVGFGTASLGSFLPTFVKAFGYSPVRTQLFTVIPYACATVTLIGVNYLSDRFNRKAPFLAGCIVTSAVGYIILMAVTSNSVRVFGTCLVAMGVFPAVILTFSWANTNVCGYTKRATTWATADVFAQCFSIIGTHIYVKPPRFLEGHAVLLGLQIWSLVMTATVYFWMRAANARKVRIEQEYLERGEAHPHMGKTLEDESDYHISFRYIL